MLRIILLLWLMVLDISDAQDHRISDRADRIALDESPPVVPILQSDLCDPLEKCPDTESLREFRHTCFTPPPPGHLYHCGTTQLKEILEFFYRKFPCRQGFYGTPKKQGEGIVVSCQKCPEGRFNPELRWSPENMDECRTHYHKTKDKNAIEYLPGNNSAPAVSYCNYHEGWASANKEMFCRESYQPCYCVYKWDSCKVLELLPDGSCERWCDGQRLPQNNFSCTQLEPSPTLRSSQTTGSNEPTPIETTKPTPPVTVEAAVKVSGVQNTTNNSSSGQIISIILGCIGLLSIVIVGAVIYKKRGPLISCIRNKKIINGHSIKCNNNKEVHVTLNDGTADSEGEDLMRGENDDN